MQPSNSPLQNARAEAARWLARQRGEDYNPEAQQQFLRWLNAEEEHRLAYEDAQKLWQELGGLGGIAHSQLAEARARIDLARHRPRYGRVLGVALAASLAGVLAWNLGWLDFIAMQTYQTEIGKHQTIALSDGSQLDLDTDSKVKVHYTDGKRELKLVRGQAVFTVAHDDPRPFDVFADELRVHDIATQFAVRKDVKDTEERITVAVLGGAVEVSDSGSATVHPLQQGQRISYSKQSDFSAIEQIDVASAAAWREGKLVFNARSLGEVLAELNRYHAAKLTVGNSQIMAVTVSGVFRTDDLPLALKTIAASLQLRLVQTGAKSWQLGIY